MKIKEVGQIIHGYIDDIQKKINNNYEELHVINKNIQYINNFLDFYHINDDFSSIQLKSKDLIYNMQKKNFIDMLRYWKIPVQYPKSVKIFIKEYNKATKMVYNFITNKNGYFKMMNDFKEQHKGSCRL